MNVLLLAPFFKGSHQYWAEGWQSHSQHNIQILSLPGRFWKWRMHGAAVEFAKQYQELNWTPDVIVATDMLDLTTFQALTRHQTHHIPFLLYFHENQLTYPWSPQDRDIPKKRDNHYSFINYTSALAADQILFNSDFHQQSFLGELPNFLNQFPDYKGMETIQLLKNKAKTLYLGMNLSKFDKYQSDTLNEQPLIVWNHRWEYDKNPEEFFEALFQLDKENLPFQLAVLGEQTDKHPKIFDVAQERLKHRIIHFGYAASFEEYARLLWAADISLTTSNQDFFGGSVVESLYCNCLPILPKRLAYPEHLPTAWHDSYFYNNESEMLDLLRQAIKNHPQKINTQTFVKKYDWKRCISEYDNVILKIKNRHVEK